MSDPRRKSPAQLDREIAEALAAGTHATKKARRESPSAWASTAAGIVVDRVRASKAYQLGREEVLRGAIAAVGPSPSPDRLRALGGLTKVVADQVAIAETPGLDANLGSPLFPHTPRSQLAREVAALRADVQLLLARGQP